MANNIDKLSGAGFNLGPANGEQQAILAGLSESEVNTLLSVKQRVDAASPEVEGHLNDSSGGWCW
jgi:hypothetical protein